MASLFGLFPFLLKLFADGGDQGTQFQAGLIYPNADRIPAFGYTRSPGG